MGIPSRGITLVAVLLVFLFLDIVAVVARLYARHLKRSRLSLDDWLILVGLFFCISTVGIGCALVFAGGAGLHASQATPEQISLILKLFVPASLVWSFAVTSVKLSILFFYITIFEWRGFRRATYAVMAITVALWVAVVLESFLLCRPFEYTWNKTVEGVCGDEFAAYMSSAIVNLAVDLLIVALPMPVLWKLQMPWRKKAAISGVLGLGVVCCVMSALRIKATLSLISDDFTYTVIPDLIYAGLEVELGIINACLPILQPVVKKFVGIDGIFSLLTRKTDRSENSDRWLRDSSKWTLGHARVKPDPYALPTTNATASYAVPETELSSIDQDSATVKVTTSVDVTRHDI